MFTLSSIVTFFAFFVAFFDPLLGKYQIFLNNIGILTGAVLLLEGVLRFREYPNKQLRKNFFPFIFLAIVIISYINMENITRRFIFHDSIISILCFLSAYFFIKNVRGKERKIASIFSLSLIFIGIWFMYRLFLAVKGTFNNEVSYYSFMGIFYIATVIWLMFYILSLLLIIGYRAQIKTEKLASTDYLTCLDNRRSISDKLQSLIDTCQSSKEKYVLFLIDLNGFKHLNDNYGHIFGDLILQKMAEKINFFEEDHLSGRLGGDEFIVIMKLDDSYVDIPLLMKSIRERIESPLFIDDYLINIKISIGYSLLFQSSQTIDELLYKADMMMYKEKTLDREMSEVLPLTSNVNI